jgi:hypothetical protein
LLYGKEKLWVSLQNCPTKIVWKRKIKKIKEER